MLNKRGKVFTGIFIILSLITVMLLVSFNKDDSYELQLIGTSYLVLDVNEQYEELGFAVYMNDNIDEQSEVVIDYGDLDTDVVGIYSIKYSLELFPDINIQRTVKVIDRIAPIITLKSGSIEITEGDSYSEPGFSAEDNYDGDITAEVLVTGEVDTDTIGNYEIIYEVTDSSDNTTSVTRIVTVIEKEEEEVVEEVVVPPAPKRPPGKPVEKPVTIPPKKEIVDKVVDDSENKEVLPPVKTAANSSNEMVSMAFTSTGISIHGVHDAGIDEVGFMTADGTVVSTFKTKVDGKEYTANLNLNSLANGTYTLVAPNNGNHKIVNKIDNSIRITNSKLGNRFINISYPDNTILVKITNSNYKYDIAIQVGHGGSDPGAMGNGYIEKELNLMVSKYEKARYEEHGLQVYMSRNSNDTYGDMTNDTSQKQLTRASTYFGNIAAQSRTAYSNHHNSSSNKNSIGWEIITQAGATRKELSIQHRLSGLWNTVYKPISSYGKMYTRDYQTGRIYSKANGEVYNFKNYYAIIRVPYENNKQNTTLYEMSFLSNKKNMDWYMKDEKWIDIAEAKVQAYVEGLGLVYRPPGFKAPVDEISYGEKEIIDTTIKFGTIIEEDPTKEVGTEGIRVAGVDGVSRIVQRNVYKNGVLTEVEILEAEKVIKEAVTEIKWVGTKEVPKLPEPGPTPDPDPGKEPDELPDKDPSDDQGKEQGESSSDNNDPEDSTVNDIESLKE